MNRERRIGMALFITAIFIILGVLAITITRESRALYYTLVFKDARGVQAGDRVQLHGVNIGEVKWVQLTPQRPPRVDVRVKIDPQYSGQVLQNSTAVIDDVSFPNVSGQRVIVVLNPDKPAPPLPKNSVIHGLGGPLEEQAWKLKGALHGVGDAFGEAIGVMCDHLKDLGESMRQIATSPEAREAVKQLGEFMKRMKDKGVSAVAQLQADWPKIRDRIKPALIQLEQLGRTRIAEELRQMVQQIERTLQEWQREAKPPTPTPASPPAPA